MSPTGQVIKGNLAFFTEEYAQEQFPTSYPVVILILPRIVILRLGEGSVPR
jgi:hypothetical protein